MRKKKLNYLQKPLIQLKGKKNELDESFQVQKGLREKKRLTRKKQLHFRNTHTSMCISYK